AVKPAWPHVRAAFVTFHAVAVALVAMPAPRADQKVLAVDDPRFATELRPWAQLFRMSDEAFARRAEAVREKWVDARAVVVGPFARYLAIAGADQPWQMFSTPNR